VLKTNKATNQLHKAAQASVTFFYYGIVRKAVFIAELYITCKICITKKWPKLCSLVLSYQQKTCHVFHLTCWWTISGSRERELHVLVVMAILFFGLDAWTFNNLKIFFHRMVLVSDRNSAKSYKARGRICKLHFFQEVSKHRLLNIIC